MGKRILAGFAAVALLLAALYLFLCPERGPTYNGRALSAWARDGNADAVVAVQKLGTNALTTALAWISFEPRPERENWYNFRYGLPKPLRRLFDPLSNDGGRERAEYARFILHVLGPQARLIAPDLLRLSTNAALPEASFRAVEAFGAMGTNGLPELITILLDKKHPYRRAAATVIGEVMARHPSAPDPTPALVQSVAEPEPDGILVKRVSEALACCKPERGLIVPTFTRLLSSTNSFVRDAARDVLQNVAPDVLTNRSAQ